MTTTKVLNEWENFLKNKTEDDYLTLYTNIPFCSSHCDFCMYTKSEENILKSKSNIDRYLDYINKRMKIFSPVFLGEKFSSIYIGGGTPSIMSIKQTERLFEIIQSNFNLDLDDKNMMAFEANPKHLNKDKIDFLSSSIINRLSMGIQTFNEDVLRAENRVSKNKEGILDLVEYSIKKFGRLNVDLMMGLKNDSIESTIRDFEILSQIGAPRITIYCNRQIRSSEDENKFQLEMIHRISILKHLFEDEYYCENKNEVYSESSFFFKKGVDHSLFDKWYNTAPEVYNHNLGFGRNANSWIVPGEISYAEENIVIDEADYNIDFIKYREIKTEMSCSMKRCNRRRNSKYSRKFHNMYSKIYF